MQSFTNCPVMPRTYPSVSDLLYWVVQCSMNAFLNRAKALLFDKVFDIQQWRTREDQNHCRGSKRHLLLPLVLSSTAPDLCFEIVQVLKLLLCLQMCQLCRCLKPFFYAFYSFFSTCAVISLNVLIIVHFLAYNLAPADKAHCFFSSYYLHLTSHCHPRHFGVFNFVFRCVANVQFCILWN